MIHGTSVSCLNSDYGDCCSDRGFCGSNETYCADGCNVLFGRCGNSTSSTVLASATARADDHTTTLASHRPLSTGAIVGIVLGGIIFWSLIGLIAEFLHRRYKQAKLVKGNTDENKHQTSVIPTSNKTHSNSGDHANITQTAALSAESLHSAPSRVRSVNHQLVDDRAAAGYEGAYRGH